MKKKRSPVKGHKLETPSSLSLKKEDRSNLRINISLILGKANLGQRVSEGHSHRDRSSLSQWTPKED